MYIESLAYDNKLPGFQQTYEAWQPPLYYSIEATAIKLLGLERPPDLPVDHNFPHSTTVFQHPNEAFPYNGPVFTMQVLRGITVLFGAGVVILTYLIALTIFPGRKLLALASAATAALVPQFAFISAMVNNDVPAVFFAALVLYFGLRFMKEGDGRWFALSAVALGLGVLTKSTVAIAGVVPLSALLGAPTPWWEKARMAGTLVAVPAAIAGWAYVRNIAMWGTIFPADLFPGGLHPKAFDEPVWRTDFWDFLVKSYWYFGGYLNISFTALPYDVLKLFPVLAAAGIVVAFRSQAVKAFQRTSLWLLVALPLLAFALIVVYSWTKDFQPQGRYLFVAQPAIAILLAFGIGTLFAKAPGKDSWAMMALPMLLLATNIWIFAVKLTAAYS